MDATEHSDCECDEKDRACGRNDQSHYRRNSDVYRESFVDDANLMVWGDRHKYKTTKELSGKVRNTAKAWACLLRATGGALKPIKCFWWLIGYIYKNGKWGYEDTEGTPMPVLGDDNEITEIPSLATSEEKKSLGVFFLSRGRQ